ncbi:M14 family metallopeptidase [Croceibacterium ferulae]|uniref:M14 family metallopeptidase n=1 Tax=Croceibacterium ferulae TaxID=1854641 RepID=UPI001F4DFA4C|nr:M14 family metallopeptidase [Croceibacterium ferulae]
MTYMPVALRRLSAPTILAAALLSAAGAAAQDEAGTLPATVLPAVPEWSGASEALIAAGDDPWITPAEAAGFTTTPRYAEVQTFLQRLDAASPLLTLGTFGQSGEGRDLLMVRASTGPGADGTTKPVVLIQAGIHAGEIDGKDAGLMLLRDIAQGRTEGLLDQVDLVFVPIYNPDGHEMMSGWNFLHINGPQAKGTVANARNLNLNRDYAKADAPETRAMIRLLQRLDPILYVDAHVSAGFDMGYDITFTYAGWGTYARHRNTADWLQDRFGPAAMAALTEAGHFPIIYPSPIDTKNPQAGIRYSPEGPRYSTGYGDFISVPTVLVENHSLKPYRQRVLGTRVLFEAALQVAARDMDRIIAAKAADRASRPEQLLTKWRPAAEPIGQVEGFRGVAFDTYVSPASGRQEQRWLGRPITFRMPIVGQEPVETVRLPRAWWVPAAEHVVIDRLRLHAITFEVIDAPRTLMLDRVTLTDPEPQPAYEGRFPLKTTMQHRQAQEVMPAGSIRVPYDQPNGLLAAALLEPESSDSFLAWGFFPQLLPAPSSSEDFVLAPLADLLLERDPQLRAAFERRLAADPAFAADGDARLHWIMDNGPHADPWHHLYPVRREL